LSGYPPLILADLAVRYISAAATVSSRYVYTSYLASW